jgi:hypothetical protein
VRGIMKKLVLLIVATATLSACAQTDANIYGCCIGQRVVGNKNYVTISNVWNEMDALPLAEQHCSAHGRSARFNRIESHRAIFDCID